MSDGPQPVAIDSLLLQLRSEHGGLCAGGCGAEPAPGALCCAACSERMARERAARAREQETAERRDAIRAALGRVVERAPAWDHARLGGPVYVAQVDATLRAWAESYQGRESACLLGPSGSGKTTAVRAWLREHCRRAASEAMADGLTAQRYRHARRILWTTAHALAGARRRHSLGVGEAPLVERAMGASLLIVDECGFEPRSEVLFEVIDERYAHRRPTVVTSGLQLAAFRSQKEGYGDALFRRLTDEGVGRLIDVWGAAC